jgi:hypothetical protein
VAVAVVVVVLCVFVWFTKHGFFFHSDPRNNVPVKPRAFFAGDTADVASKSGRKTNYTAFFAGEMANNIFGQWW